MTSSIGSSEDYVGTSGCGEALSGGGNFIRAKIANHLDLYRESVKLPWSRNLRFRVLHCQVSKFADPEHSHVLIGCGSAKRSPYRLYNRRRRSALLAHRKLCEE